MLLFFFMVFELHSMGTPENYLQRYATLCSRLANVRGKPQVLDDLQALHREAHDILETHEKVREADKLAMRGHDVAQLWRDLSQFRWDSGTYALYHKFRQEYHRFQVLTRMQTQYYENFLLKKIKMHLDKLESLNPFNLSLTEALSFDHLLFSHLLEGYNEEKLRNMSDFEKYPRIMLEKGIPDNVEAVIQKFPFLAEIRYKGKTLFDQVLVKKNCSLAMIRAMMRLAIPISIETLSRKSHKLFLQVLEEVPDSTELYAAYRESKEQKIEEVREPVDQDDDFFHEENDVDEQVDVFTLEDLVEECRKILSDFQILKGESLRKYMLNPYIKKILFKQGDELSHCLLGLLIIKNPFEKAKAVIEALSLNDLTDYQRKQIWASIAERELQSPFNKSNQIALCNLFLNKYKSMGYDLTQELMEEGIAECVCRYRSKILLGKIMERTSKEFWYTQVSTCYNPYFFLPSSERGYFENKFSTWYRSPFFIKKDRLKVHSTVAVDFHKFIEDGNFAQVNTMLKQGSCTAATRNQMTQFSPLHTLVYAFMKRGVTVNDRDILQLLLNNRADITAEAPLDVAGTVRSLRPVELVFELFPTNLLDRSNNHCADALLLFTPLIYAMSLSTDKERYEELRSRILLFAACKKDALVPYISPFYDQYKQAVPGWRDQLPDGRAVSLLHDAVYFLNKNLVAELVKKGFTKDIKDSEGNDVYGELLHVKDAHHRKIVNFFDFMLSQEIPLEKKIAYKDSVVYKLIEKLYKVDVESANRIIKVVKERKVCLVEEENDNFDFTALLAQDGFLSE